MTIHILYIQIDNYDDWQSLRGRLKSLIPQEHPSVSIFLAYGRSEQGRKKLSKKDPGRCLEEEGYEEEEKDSKGELPEGGTPS